MRVLALAVVFAVASSARAQPDLPPPAPPPAAAPVNSVVTHPPADVPPIIVVEPTPVAAPPQVATPAAPAADAEECRPGVIRTADEYLMWWVKAAPLPALAARTRFGMPLLGDPQTRVLIGEEPLDLGEVSGGRFGTGWHFTGKTAGVEANYWFIGTRTTTLLAAGTAEEGAPVLARPYTVASTGEESGLFISAPGFRVGEFRTASSVRAQGTEINLVGELARGESALLVGLAGYRFVQVHEGLGLWQQGFDLLPGFNSVYVATFDQFDAHNRFHGGQVGLRAELDRGPVFVELTGKVAFGQTTQVVKVGGSSTLVGVGLRDGVRPGGLLALASNSGRLTREAFAVVPEAIARVGVETSEHTRFFVGYNFLYLSEAVRPGDQIDRTLNLTQLPRPFGSGALVGPERPVLAVRSSDLWLQGLMIGFETKY